MQLQLYKHLPLPSDRMGSLWALSSIEGACIIEYGPAGTTHFATEGLMLLNAELNAKLFSTHMDEDDIVMGNTSRLEETIKEVDAAYSPPVIFVLASAISSLIGTDVESICEDLQSQVSATLIPFTGGGFRGDYTLGVKEVLTALATQVVKPPLKKKERTYNIIGSCIDAYNYTSDLNEIKRIMQDCFGYHLHTAFTSDSSLKNIATAANAEFNIVLRTEGIACAEILKEKYGLKFISGSPYGLQGTRQWLKKIAETFDIKANATFLEQETKQLKSQLLRIRQATFSYQPLEVVLAGNYGFALNVVPFLNKELGLQVKQIFVNHNKAGFANDINNNPIIEKMLFNSSEEEKENLIKEIKPAILLGDGVLLEMGKDVPVKIQLANPNLHHIQIFDQTPFMGFKGVLYLLELLLNQISRHKNRLKG